MHDARVTQPSAPADARHCIKCGREVGPDETLCQICNRAGMSTPSASQYHGTVVAAIVLAVAGLAVAASLSMRGVGPYAAHVREVVAGETSGYAITLDVTNDGSSSGRAKCQVLAFDGAGRRIRAVNTITDRIDGGASTSVTITIPGLEEEPASVTASCT
jgi:predicted nucleic acid-binding Zn ribbon protein